MMLATGLRLFLWFEWPERRPGPQIQCGPTCRSFCLLPTNYWEVAKVIAKTNAVLALLLVPLAVLLSFSPAFHLLLNSTRVSPMLPLKSLLLVGCCSLVFPALSLTAGFESGLKYSLSIPCKFCFPSVKPRCILRAALGA